MTTPKTKTAVLEQERKRLGIRENPPGSNRTPIGAEFGWNGVAWCAETQVVCLRDAGFFEVPKDAGAWSLADSLCRLKGWKKISAAAIVSGDIVSYTFSHIGFCESRKDSGHIVAIEGNHNDAVMRVVRANSSIRFGIRPPYAPEPAPKPISGGRKATVLRDTACYSRTRVDRWFNRKGTYLGFKAGRGGIVTVELYSRGWARIHWGGHPTCWVSSSDIKAV